MMMMMIMIEGILGILSISMMELPFMLYCQIKQSNSYFNT